MGDSALAAEMTSAKPQAECAEQQGPLSGLTILDLTQIYNGPYATFLMAAAGATVLKIEPPDGEQLRKRTANPSAWLPYAMLNSGKQSLKLNLKTSEGREILLSLVETADVLVENFAAGVMDRLGLGIEVLKSHNPDLIYAASSGYGSDGPYRDYPAMDLTMQAMCGFMSSTGFPDAPPVKAGPAVCDFLAGVHLYSAVVTAIAGRALHGHAPTVEVSMMEASYFSMTSSMGLVHDNPEGAPERTGNRHSGLGVCPYNVYPTSDGYAAIIVVAERHWTALTTLMDRPEMRDDPRYATNLDRVRSMDEVDGIVAEWTAGQTRDEVVAKLVGAGVPSAPVRTLKEVMHDPHLIARGSLRMIDHPEYGRLSVPASPLRFDGAASLPERPSVPLGTDSRAILRQRLGLTDDDIDALSAQGII